MSITTRPRLALDRRAFDRDGHLSVSNNVMTRVGVSPYRGAEIPDHEALGLDPDRTYFLLRPADELKRAAPGLAGKPLLMVHRPISATDHPHKLVVGSIGSDVTFDGVAVRGSLVVWEAGAIGGIANDEVRALSCGYHYVARMQPGTWLGQYFDGTMTQIDFNHCAIVPRGRVPGAMVGDTMPLAFIRRKSMSGTQTTDPDEDYTIDPRDDLATQLQKFLVTRLNDDDYAKVVQMLTDSDPAMQQAEDHIRAARARLAQDAAARQRYEARFPHANRLSR